MPFDQSAILDVSAAPSDAELLVSWDTSAAAGTWFQVYLDGAKVWAGQATSCLVPHPSGPLTIAVGTVLASEAALNLAAQLPAPPALARIRIAWIGGTFLDPTIAGFRVYQATAAGAAVSFAAPVAVVPAYSAGIVTDGWGLGGWNQGGWGQAAASYSWTSGPLTTGSWSVAVVCHDAAGNESAPISWTIAVVAPPQPIPPNAAGKRLTYTTAATTVGGVPSTTVTLDWLASPG